MSAAASPIAEKASVERLRNEPRDGRGAPIKVAVPKDILAMIERRFGNVVAKKIAHSAGQALRAASGEWENLRDAVARMIETKAKPDNPVGWLLGMTKKFATETSPYRNDRAKRDEILRGWLVQVRKAEGNPLSHFQSSIGVICQLFDAVQLDDLPEGVDESELRILEPSAGTGAIVRAIDSAKPDVGGIVAVEVDPAMAAMIDRDFDVANNDVTVVEGDFMAQTVESLGGPFHKIVMNPPFVLRDDPVAYVDHVLHAYTMLAPGGRLAAVTPVGWLYPSKHRKVEQFREFVDEYGSHQLLPAKSFEHAGTSVRATIVMFEAGSLRPIRPRRTPPGDAPG